jgi:hypothetical protein
MKPCNSTKINSGTKSGGLKDTLKNATNKRSISSITGNITCTTELQQLDNASFDKKKKKNYPIAKKKISESKTNKLNCHCTSVPNHLNKQGSNLK